MKSHFVEAAEKLGALSVKTPKCWFCHKTLELADADIINTYTTDFVYRCRKHGQLQVVYCMIVSYEKKDKYQQWEPKVKLTRFTIETKVGSGKMGDWCLYADHTNNFSTSIAMFSDGCCQSKYIDVPELDIINNPPEESWRRAKNLLIFT